MDDALSSRRDAGIKHDVVEQHVVGALDRVRVDVAAATMRGREVKNCLNTLRSPSRESGIAQVAREHIYLADHLYEIFSRTTGEVIGDAHMRPMRNEELGEVTADERGSAGYEDALTHVRLHIARE